MVEQITKTNAIWQNIINYIPQTNNRICLWKASKHGTTWKADILLHFHFYFPAQINTSVPTGRALGRTLAAKLFTRIIWGSKKREKKAHQEKEALDIFADKGTKPKTRHLLAHKLLTANALKAERTTAPVAQFMQRSILQKNAPYFSHCPLSEPIESVTCNLRVVARTNSCMQILEF